MTNTLPFAFRSMAVTDRGYITKSFNRTYRDNNKKMNGRLYYKQADSMFNSILDRFSAIVVCNPNEISQIYGFCVAAYISNEEWVCFWIQIKQIYQGLGIGTSLFEFVKGDRKGPITVFLREKSKPYADKYEVMDSPMLLSKILGMEMDAPDLILIKEL